MGVGQNGLGQINKRARMNKMGNPYNGPAAVKWYNIFCLDGYYGSTCKLVTLGCTWSHLVTFFIVEVKELHNNGCNGCNCSAYYGHIWSQYGHMWSHLVKFFVVEVTELHSDGLNCIMAKIPPHNMVTGWSQVVTFVTG